MCNAWNHWAGCTCGFGGEGHLGGGYGGGYGGGHGGGTGTGSQFPIYFSYGDSMLGLAAELGYSVVFPTICRYCGEPIFLFASPDGSFAIFDSLGIPWPKHECWGVQRDTSNYTSLSLVCSSQYRLPVPKSASVISRKTGTVRGVVVSRKELLKPDCLVKYSIFDGTNVFEIFSVKNLDIGKFIEGDLEIVSEKAVLREPHFLSEDSQTKSNLSRRARVASKALRRSDIWDLQFVVDRLRSTDPNVCRFLEATLEALASSFPITGILLLSQAIAITSDAWSRQDRTRYLKLLLTLIDESRLHTAVPALRRSLAGRFRHSLDDETSNYLSELATIGELKLKNESISTRHSVFDNQWKKESKYSEIISGTSGIDLAEIMSGFRTAL